MHLYKTKSYGLWLTGAFYVLLYLWSCSCLGLLPLNNSAFNNLWVCVCVWGGGGESQDVVYSLFTLAGPCITVPLTILQAAARAMAQSVVLHWHGPLLLLFIILAHQLPQLFLFLHPFGAVVYNGVVTSEGFCLALVIALISKRSFMKISLKLNASQSAYHVQYQHTRDKCHRNTAKTRVA